MSAAEDERGLSPGKKRPWLLPLNNPPVIGTAGAVHMRADDLVIGVVIGGRARAYPWWIVANYHVVNDTLVTSDEPAGYLISAENNLSGKPIYPWFESTPLLVTLCEACAGAAAFIPLLEGDAGAPDEPLVFSIVEGGSATGAFVAGGTFTICDLRTRSRWHPLVGRAATGPLGGRALRRVPVMVDRWDAWRREHPTGDVLLAGDEMRRRPHGVDHMPSVDDPDGAHTSVLVARKKRPESIDRRLAPGEMILGAGAPDGRAVAFPLSRLRAVGGLAQLDVADEPCVFLSSGARHGAVFHRTVGERVLDFELRSASPFVVVDASGTAWNARGEAIEGPYSGRRLRVVSDSYVSKWSEWSMSHPAAIIVS